MNSKKIFVISAALPAVVLALFNRIELSANLHVAWISISLIPAGFVAGVAVSSVFRKNDYTTLFFYLTGISSSLSILLVQYLPFNDQGWLWAASEFLHLILFLLIASVPFFMYGIMTGANSSPALIGLSLGFILLPVFRSIDPDYFGAGLVLLVTVLCYFYVSSRRLLKYLLLPFFFVLIVCVKLSIDNKAAVKWWKPLGIALNNFGAMIKEPGFNYFKRIDLLELNGSMYFSINGDIKKKIMYKTPLNRNMDFLTESLPFMFGGIKKIASQDAPPVLIEYFSEHYMVEEFANFTILPDIGGLEKHIKPSRHGLLRGFLRGNDKLYDLILIYMDDLLERGTAYSYFDSFAITEEAITDYLQHLDQKGLLFIKMNYSQPYRSEIKVFNAIVNALEENGSEPSESLVFLRSGMECVFLVKADGYSNEETEMVRNYAVRQGLTPDFYLGTPGEYGAATQNFTYFPGNGNAANFDFRSITDDMPFVAKTIRFLKIPEAFKEYKFPQRMILDEGGMSPYIFLQNLLISILLLFTVLKKNMKATEKKRAFWMSFALSGCAVMAIVFFGLRFKPFYWYSDVRALVPTFWLTVIFAGRFYNNSKRKLLFIFGPLWLMLSLLVLSEINTFSLFFFSMPVFIVLGCFPVLPVSDSQNSIQGTGIALLVFPAFSILIACSYGLDALCVVAALILTITIFVAKKTAGNNECNKNLS